jgi:putative Mn2+ efflux pump MntP
MNTYEIFLIALGLSMDAFAAAVCKGLEMKGRIKKAEVFIIAALFGLFQAVMPVIGYYAGISFEEYIKSADHWIAFILLGSIGGKMIVEAVKGGGCDVSCGEYIFNIKEILMLAVATSIDALAVGITLAVLREGIAKCAVVTGITTFIMSCLGVLIGKRFGSKYKSRAELMGGIILVLIGVKILLEHLL